MRYAVVKNSVSCRAVDDAYQASIAEIIFDGEYPNNPIWDDTLQTIREKNASELLNDHRLAKIELLKADCTTAIQAGFVSSALGEAHTYDSKLPQDQTNLLGAKIAGVDMDFTCTDSTGYKSQKFHTVAQMAQVYQAGMVHLQTQKARFYARKLAVEQAQTIDAVNAVVW